jgi:hypothetical protein
MLRDDSTDHRRKPLSALNVLGEPLEICSFQPMTGFYRWLLQHWTRRRWQSHGLRRDDGRIS